MANIPPLPHDFNRSLYHQQLLQRMRTSEIVIFDALFIPTKYSRSCTARYLLAGTSNGIIHIFNLSNIIQTTEKSNDTTILPQYYPVFTFQAHSIDTSVYCLAFIENSSTPLIVSGGDEDARFWSWNEILDAIEHNKALQPIYTKSLPQSSTGKRLEYCPVDEINDIDVILHRNALLLAGGNGIGYKIDIETQKVHDTFKGHDDYLHAIRSAPTMGIVATGSEDGTVKLWDERDGSNYIHTFQSSTGSVSNFVAAVAIDTSESWLAIGGGPQKCGLSSPMGGFITVYHLPSRSQVQTIQSSCETHALHFQPQSSVLLSGGNENTMKKWNACNTSNYGDQIKPLSTTKCKTASLHFVKVDPETQMIALGGLGPIIEISIFPGAIAFALVIHS